MLPFLDVCIYRESNCLKYSVYRKPTNNLSYIHFYSGHSNRIKESVFISMFLRAYRICSPEFFDTEIKIVYNIGKNLCYPVQFLDECFAKSRKIFYKNPSNRNEAGITPNKNVLIIPYWSQFVDLPRILSTLGLKVVFKYTNTLKNILIKNSPPNDNNIIYKIPCTDCNKIYIGQTSKGLDVRIKQHQYNVRQHHTNSAIFQHSFNEDHRINWHNSNKIIKSNNYFERNIIESFLIDCTNNNFNIGKGMFIFDPLIKELLKIDLKNLFKLL